MHGPSSSSRNPASSRSSRATASPCVSPGSRPPPRARPHCLVRELEADEEDPTGGVEHERANGVAQRLPARPPRELLEPPAPLLVRHRRVRRRRRREDEEPRVAEPPLLHAELRPLVEGASVRLLADEGDPRRMELAGQPREPLRRPREVGPPEVARARGGAVGRVRQPEAERRQVVLLLRRVEPRSESGVPQQPPEVVARVREVGARGRRPAARVDAAEDHTQAGREDIGNSARSAPRRLRARSRARARRVGLRRGV